MAFEDYDFTGFWDDDKRRSARYAEDYPDDAMIASVEAEVGFRLPASYVELARLHNGGLVRKDAFAPGEPAVWADDHVRICGLYGIGRAKPYSLCGEMGSAFMIEEWGYPRIGVCIADTPSAGHEQIMLDYRACGPDGDPQVVHVDQELGYRITVLAPDFETFVKGLVADQDLEDLQADLQAAQTWLTTSQASPWDDSQFLVTMRAEARDRPGLLPDLTQAIGGQGASILSQAVTAPGDQVAVITVTLEVGEAAQLGRVLRAVRSVSGVWEVYRAAT